MDSYEQNQDVTLRDYMRVLFRHKAVIVTTIITVCATVFVGLKLKTKVYESKVKMLITAEKQVEATYLREMYDGRNVQQTLTQSEIVKSTPVLNRVILALALHKRAPDSEKKFASPLKAKLIDYQARKFNEQIETIPQEQRDDFLFRQALDSLKKNIKVEPIRDTNMFTISVTDYNPVAAAVIANVVSRSYVIFDLQQQLAELKLKYGEKHPTVSLIEDNIAQMEKTLDGQPVDDVEAIGPASVKIMDQASVAMEPTGTPKALTFLLAIVMSVFLGVMLAFIFEYADQTLKTPRDIRKALDLDVLGSIPQKRFFERKLILKARRETPYVRSFKTLCDRLFLLIKEKGFKTFLVAPCSPVEKAAFVVANLGIYLADKFGYKTLIIDADFRHPAMNRIFKMKTDTGLSAVVEDGASLENAVWEQGENLDVLPAGKTTSNPLTILGSARMREMLNKAREKYQVILVHGGNLQDSQNTEVLAKHLDGIALVITERVSRRQVVRQAVSALNGSRDLVLGVILNGRTFPIPKFVYDRV